MLTSIEPSLPVILFALFPSAVTPFKVPGSSLCPSDKIIGVKLI
jgi:hypothetical protein